MSYWSVHHRLQTELGPAAERCCTECGLTAVDWSYDGKDPDERTDPARGYRYSLQLAHYRPRCRACHRRATPRRQSCSGAPDGPRAARLYRAGASSRGIAALLDTSPTAVLAALRGLGVDIRPSGRTRRRQNTDPNRSMNTDHDQHAEREPQHRLPTQPTTKTQSRTTTKRATDKPPATTQLHKQCDQTNASRSDGDHCVIDIARPAPMKGRST